MKALIAWLIRIEDLANIFYNDAAAFFHHDLELSRFLRHLAEDEKWHSRIMVRAGGLADRSPLPPSGIVLDSETMARIECPFIESRKALEQGRCTRETLLRRMVAVEYSEWNDVFLYVINSLKEQSREFADAASKMHQHKKFMERFLASLPDGQSYLEQIRGLPAVWQEKILVIEDDPVLRQFFADILSSEGSVSTAVNGQEGLDKAREQHFDVILSDLQMPVMDGIEFYRKASILDPALRDHVLFLTGNPSDEHLSFFRQNSLQYLLKPVEIEALEQAVRAVIRRTRSASSSTALS